MPQLITVKCRDQSDFVRLVYVAGLISEQEKTVHNNAMYVHVV